MPRRTNQKGTRPPTPVYTPTKASLPTRKALADLTEAEALLWIGGLRERLLRKQEREGAYLDRRAARGTRTPTDEAYEADQQLEDELLALLDELEETYHQHGVGAP